MFVFDPTEESYTDLEQRESEQMTELSLLV